MFEKTVVFDDGTVASSHSIVLTNSADLIECKDYVQFVVNSYIDKSAFEDGCDTVHTQSYHYEFDQLPRPLDEWMLNTVLSSEPFNK